MSQIIDIKVNDKDYQIETIDNLSKTAKLLLSAVAGAVHI